MRIEPLEPRIAFSAAAMGLVGLTEARSHPFFSRFDGSGGTVVVIDQPIDWASPSLASRRITDIDLLGTAGPITGETHGTFVASIVGSSIASIGVAPGAGIIGILSDGSPAPSGTDPNEVWRLNENDIERLLRWVLDHHQQHNIVAVNMSLGDGRFYTSAGQVAQRVLNDEIAALEAAGVVVISAAGNKYPDNQAANAAYPAIVSTLAVGAVYAADVGPQPSIGANSTGPDRLAPFSQRPAPGPGNALFAPGAMVRGLLQGTTQATGSGTSFASPYVAGAVAILQQAAVEISGSRLPVADLVQIMLDTAVIIVDGDDEDDTVENTGLSFPRINIIGALEAIDARYSRASIAVIGGAKLDQPIGHEIKAKRSNGTGFGPVQRDDAHKEHVFFITNLGSGTLRIDRAEVRGQSPEHFSITLAPPSSVAPGATVAIVVRFDPESYGTRRANIALFTSDAERRRFTMKIAGVGIPPASAPDIDITGGTTAIRAGDRKARPGTGTRFGLAPIGTPVEHIFTIRNRGGSPLVLETGLFFIAGPNPADFAVTALPGAAVLDPGKGTTFRVTFTPTAPGQRKADILIISNDPDETPFVFRIVGSGA